MQFDSLQSSKTFVTCRTESTLFDLTSQTSSSLSATTTQFSVFSTSKFASISSFMIMMILRSHDISVLFCQRCEFSQRVSYFSFDSYEIRWRYRSELWTSVLRWTEVINSAVKKVDMLFKHFWFISIWMIDSEDSKVAYFKSCIKHSKDECSGGETNDKVIVQEI